MSKALLDGSNFRFPTYFLSHGGGPWPFMKHELGGLFDKLENSIADVRGHIPQPRAVLVVTGHWENAEFAVSAGASPPMLYDYSGFPAYAYEVHYKAAGEPKLAARIASLLEDGGMRCRLDHARGFDHGTVSVMVSLFPNAKIPTLQLSLRTDLSPEVHLQAGRLLAPLRADGVLIVGSGMSYHNLSVLNARARDPSRQFDAWLHETLTRSVGSIRHERLVEWLRAPAARQSHPREDHLLPLMVVVGAAEEETGACIYHEDAFWGFMALSSFRFGADMHNAPRN